MTSWKLGSVLFLAGITLTGAGRTLADEPPKAPPEGTLIVVDNAGKEHKLKSWKFAQGVRRLAWLAPAAKEGDKTQPAGPEALELREENSTDFKEGILTLVLLDRIRSIDYDADKENVTVHVATGEKDEEVALVGSTAYVGVNKLTIESEVDKGDLGVASVKFQAGTARGIRSLRFPSPKAAAILPGGREATITAVGKAKDTLKATDLQPLYDLGDGGQKLVPTLFFKKTLKIDINKIQKLQAGTGRSEEGPEWEVTLKDGDSNTLTLLKTVALDGKPATLNGLVGRVPGGHKLFPPATVAEVQFDEAKPEKPEKTDK